MLQRISTHSLLLLLCVFLSGGCATFRSASADPDLLNTPVFMPLAGGKRVTIELVSVNGATIPREALERAVARFDENIVGHTELVEGDPVTIDVGDDGAMSQEQFDAVVAGSSSRGAYSIVIVVAPDTEFFHEPAMYVYNYSNYEHDDTGLFVERDTPHAIIVNAKGMTGVLTVPLWFPRKELWEFVLTHELSHSLGVPSDKSHAWDGGHCTHGDCLLYPGVNDFRSITRVFLFIGPSKTLCSTCRAEISASLVEAARHSWEGEEDYIIARLDRMVAMNPDRPSVYRSRRAYYRDCEEYEKALLDATKVVELEPTKTNPRNQRGFIYLKLKDYGHAVADYETAVRLNESEWEASANLAWILSCAPVAEVRDGARAVEYATRACELTEWKNSVNLAILAGAFAEAGDFESAVANITKAIAVDDGIHASGLQERLALFEAGQPYREGEPGARTVQD